MMLNHTSKVSQSLPTTEIQPEIKNLSNSKPMANYMDTKFKSRGSGISMITPDECYIGDDILLNSDCEMLFERRRTYDVM